MQQLGSRAGNGYSKAVSHRILDGLYFDADDGIHDDKGNDDGDDDDEDDKVLWKVMRKQRL